MHKKLEFPSCKYQFFSTQVTTCITPTLQLVESCPLSTNLESV